MRALWEVDYYAEILDLREKNRKLLEALKELVKHNRYDDTNPVTNARELIEKLGGWDND